MVIEGGQLQSARIGGQALDPQREYRLALSNFTAAAATATRRSTSPPGLRQHRLRRRRRAAQPSSPRNSPLKAADFEPGGAVQRR
jgi:5'-nucleotidase/UDP-sugar diphosphatase